MTTKNLLIYIPFNGGIGGAERLAKHLQKTIEKSEHTATFVYHYKINGSDGRFLLDESPNVKLLSIEKIDTLADQHFDVFYCIPIKYEWKSWTKFIAQIPLKVILWLEGSTIHLAKHFDFIHYESRPESTPKHPYFVCTPNPIHTIDNTDDIEYMKSIELYDKAYYLSVFNPYDLAKHYKGMIASLDNLDRKLVWCTDPITFRAFGDRIVDHQINNIDHQKLIIVKSPTIGQLYTLYRHCDAYICYSLIEGLGWAMLDAAVFDKPIIAGKVGIAKDYLTKFVRDFGDKNIVSLSQKMKIDFNGGDIIDKLTT